MARRFRSTNIARPDGRAEGTQWIGVTGRKILLTGLLRLLRQTTAAASFSTAASIVNPSASWNPIAHSPFV